MTIDTGLIAGFITLIIALLAFASWVGALHQKVKTNGKDIVDIRNEFGTYQKQNRQDHQQITARLDKILQNNRKG